MSRTNLIGPRSLAAIWSRDCRALSRHRRRLNSDRQAPCCPEPGWRQPGSFSARAAGPGRLDPSPGHEVDVFRSSRTRQGGRMSTTVQQTCATPRPTPRPTLRNRMLTVHRWLSLGAAAFWLLQAFLGILIVFPWEITDDALEIG